MKSILPLIILLASPFVSAQASPASDSADNSFITLALVFTVLIAVIVTLAIVIFRKPKAGKEAKPDQATASILKEIAAAKAAREEEAKSLAPEGEGADGRVVHIFGAPDREDDQAPWKHNGATALRGLANVFLVLVIILFIAAFVLLVYGCSDSNAASAGIDFLLSALGGVFCLFLRAVCLALAAMADAATRYLDSPKR